MHIIIYMLICTPFYIYAYLLIYANMLNMLNIGGMIYMHICIYMLICTPFYIYAYLIIYANMLNMLNIGGDDIYAYLHIYANMHPLLYICIFAYNMLICTPFYIYAYLHICKCAKDMICTQIFWYAYISTLNIGGCRYICILSYIC